MPGRAEFTLLRTFSAVSGILTLPRTSRIVRRSLVILNPSSCPGTWSPTVWCLCSESMRSLPRQGLYENAGSHTYAKQPGNDLQRILRIVVLTKEYDEPQPTRSPETRHRRAKTDCARDVQLRDRHTGSTVRYEPEKGYQNRLEDRVSQEHARQVLLPDPIDEQPDGQRCHKDKQDDLSRPLRRGPQDLLPVGA